MSLHTIRDSWEEWRRKVNLALGGVVGEIDASEVAYSNTSSGLTATNVQSAIDEVVGDIGVVDGKVDTVGNKLGAIQQLGRTQVNKTVSSGTYIELLNSVANDLLTIISNMADNEIIELEFVAISNFITCVITPYRYFNNATDINIIGQAVTIGANEGSIRKVSFSKNAGYISQITMGANSNSFSTLTNNTISSETTCSIIYKKYKTIS